MASSFMTVKNHCPYEVSCRWERGVPAGVKELGEIIQDWTLVGDDVFSGGVIEGFPGEQGEVFKYGKSWDVGVYAQLEFTVKTNDGSKQLVYDVSLINGDPFKGEGHRTTVYGENVGDVSHGGTTGWCWSVTCPPIAPEDFSKTAKQCPSDQVYQYNVADRERPGPVRTCPRDTYVLWELCAS